MKGSRKLNPRTRRRLFVVMMLAALAVAALAAVYPNMLVGPKGGSLAGY